MLAFLSIIPARVWAELAGLAALLIAFGTYTVHERRIGAAHEVAAVEAASAKTLAQANEQLHQLAVAYDARVTAIQEKQNADLKAAAAESDDLTRRLRNYEANHNRCPVLQGAAAPDASGTPSAGSVERAFEGVVAAAAHDHAVCEAERAERDALTGK